MSDEWLAADHPAGHPLPRGLMHSLRTPLNHVIGYSELLQEELAEAGQGQYLPHLEKVHAAAYHLLSLIEESFHAADAPAAPVPALIEAPALVEAPEPKPPAAAFFDQRDGPLSGPDAPHGLLLVVDDIDSNRDLLARRLERLGYAAATAADGPEALAMLAAGSFDLVLLDIMMPDMDGYEVLRRIKADERLRHLPVVMISALSELDTAARCIELGAEDFLAKPFSPALLGARVQACLEKKRVRDQERLAFERMRIDNERLRARLKARDGEA